MNFGKRGILDVEIVGNSIKKTFLQLDERTFEELELNISDMNSEEELVENINSLDLNKSVMYKLILVRRKRV